MKFSVDGIRNFLKNFWRDPKERRSLWWVSRILWGGVLLSVFSLFLIIVIIANSDLPDFEDLENPQYDLASEIYDSEGLIYGKYYIENRVFVKYEELSRNILDALLSVEDNRYFQHSGIDARALLRVAVKSILLGQSSSGGGSTISQQLAKLLFKRSSLAGKSTIGRAIALASIKIKEWITAVKLERSYTKEEIIAMYLSKFEFINGAHGIQSAAKIYYNKDQKDLEISEAALLVGMLKNPARFNPMRFPERSEGRRNTVLQMLYKNDKLDLLARDSLLAKPIDMSSFERTTQSEGLAPYFRSELTKWLRDLLLKPEYHKPEGGPYDIYRDGLRIYTTIDSRYQVLAEKAVTDHMKLIQERYWQAWRRMDPFKFEATNEQENLRRASLERRIRETDVYQGLYVKHFTELSATCEEQFGIILKEPTIRRLIDDPGYINSIEESLRPTFEKLVFSNRWGEIKRQWAMFQKNVKEKFEEEIDARVFAHNEEGEEVIRMTRLDSVIYLLRHMQAGLLSIDPVTGEIKAWVGGIGHKYFKYDHVTMRRQVGSTIKPFVYATAIGVQGISPCQEFSDIQYTIAPGDADFKLDAEWSPSNANGLFTQNKYNLYQGLLYSKNSITVRILKEMGTVELVRDLLHNVGIDKYARLPGGRLVVPEVPSIGLGSVDLSLMEMVGGYTSFSNGGLYTEPRFIDRIEDKNGRIVYQSAISQHRAINPLYNAVMVDMLRNNTGGRFGLGIKSDNGGKTGTTNDYADGWFIGITPRLVTGVWVGGDEKWVRFYTLDDGQGFVMARPIFQNYMKMLEEDENIHFNTDAKFPEPPPGFGDLIDCTRYKQADPDDERAERMQAKIDLDEFEEDEFEDSIGDEFDEEMKVDTLMINRY